MSRIEARLKELGITLPAVPTPAANYVPFMVTGKLVFIAGQLPLVDGKVTCTGKVGAGVTVDEAKAAARICGINIFAALKAACGGDLDKVSRCVRLGGFSNAAPDFVDTPTVINGASDLIVEVMGDAGKHARTAVGAMLPRHAAVEVDAIFELK
ncbi:MAG: RidA family protein [Burkholderiales bacterium]